ncbi:MAG: polyprenyl synthetase family protein, partial [Cohaesibacteraceae bacterium]|nr:polyprenyl synthetase family protein [Cohaesibacteraceae bacterium]
EVGPVLQNSSRDERAAFRSYGQNLGLAFQLIDDALDYGGSSIDLGKNTGDDFREGKITLPVVLAFRRGNEKERSFWKRCLEQSDIVDGDLQRAMDLMQKHNGLQDTVARARHYGDIARDALGLFPDSDHKSALIDVVDFCIGRAH